MPAAAAWVSVGELRDADGLLCPRELRAMRMWEGFVLSMRLVVDDNTPLTIRVGVSDGAASIIAGLERPRRRRLGGVSHSSLRSRLRFTISARRGLGDSAHRHYIVHQDDLTVLYCQWDHQPNFPCSLLRTFLYPRILPHTVRAPYLTVLGLLCQSLPLSLAVPTFYIAQHCTDEAVPDRIWPCSVAVITWDSDYMFPKPRFDSWHGLSFLWVWSPGSERFESGSTPAACPL